MYAELEHQSQIGWLNIKIDHLSIDQMMHIYDRFCRGVPQYLFNASELRSPLLG